MQRFRRRMRDSASLSGAFATRGIVKVEFAARFQPARKDFPSWRSEFSLTHANN
jgi:hypothetical protein